MIISNKHKLKRRKQQQQRKAKAKNKSKKLTARDFLWRFEATLSVFSCSGFGAPPGTKNHQNRSKIALFVQHDFNIVFDRFGVVLGRHLGALWAPKSTQDGLKSLLEPSFSAKSLFSKKRAPP